MKMFCYFLVDHCHSYKYIYQDQYNNTAMSKPVKLKPNVKKGRPLKQQTKSYKKTVFTKGVVDSDGEEEFMGLQLLHQKEEDKDKKVVAVILSFHSSQSYDQLFEEVQQKTDEGTRVLVYVCSSNFVTEIQKGFDGESEDETVKEFVNRTKQVDPDCVVFNWECSGGYEDCQIPEKPQVLFKFLKLVLERGHMAMFSDFSLKSLIKKWNPDILGPSPFVLDENQFNHGSFELYFNNNVLKECPSAQLQIVGEMAEDGKCHVETLPGTILYGINPEVKSELYDLELLTIAKDLKLSNEKYLVKIDENIGAVGHTLLRYKSGGMLITSMSHWIELMKIDTSQEKLFEIAEREYGKMESVQMRMEFDSLNEVKKKEYIKMKSVNFVQNQAPCSNMSKKIKMKKK